MLRLRRSALATGLAAAIATTAPAVAGESAAVTDLRPQLLPPADTGKPSGVMPPASDGPATAGHCLPPLPCGTRLYGTLRRDGGVELQVPALRW